MTGRFRLLFYFTGRKTVCYQSTREIEERWIYRACLLGLFEGEAYLLSLLSPKRNAARCPASVFLPVALVVLTIPLSLFLICVSALSCDRPVGPGKTALMLTLCLTLPDKYDIAAVTTDIFTR